MTDLGPSEVQVVKSPSRTRSLSVADVVEASYERDRLKSPVVRNFARNILKKWRESQEKKINKRLAEVKIEKRKREVESKEIARVITRTIPLDLLAKDWLNDNEITADIRMYLIDKLMPTLILGVDKLLKEVEKRNLAESERFCSNFNPINYLAQYLMRNNPKYSNFAEASPYARGLRKVSEDLKKEVFALEENKLAKLKAEAQLRKIQREKKEQAKKLENLRRAMALEEQFYEWTSEWQGVLPQSVVQNVLISFLEYTETLPVEIRKGAVFSTPIGPTDTSGKLLDLPKFQKYLKVYIESLSTAAFDEFVKHLSRCGTEYRNVTLRQQVRMILKTLFMNCDHNNAGYLDRKRILNLLWSFYVRQDEPIKMALRNPKQWPVVEIEESEEGENDKTDIVEPKEYEKAESEKVVENKNTHDKEEEGKDGGRNEGEPKDYEKAESEEVVENKNTHDEEEEGKDRGRNEGEPKDYEKAEGEVVENENTHDEEEEGKDGGRDEGEEKDNEEDRESTKEKIERNEDRQNHDRVEDLRSSMSEETESSVPPRPESVTTGSKFDENSLNLPQFIHLVEKFLGDEPMKSTMDVLVKFIRSGYFESDEEMLARINKAKMEALSAKRRRLVDNLFDLWDVNGSGLLDTPEIGIVLGKWRVDAPNKFNEAFRFFEAVDSSLGRKDLRDCIDAICRLFPDEDPFESLVAFLTSCVERSFEERKRGDARKKWLKMIDAAAQTSGAQLDPVYRAVFQVLFKDAQEHGRDKVISASISMLENNDDPELLGRGETVLRYVAATNDDIPYVLGKVVYRDMKAVSWTAVDSGKPVHVPKVSNHNGVQLWNPTRKKDCEGSFIVLPIKDHEKRVIGILGIDTLADPVSKSVFITHEISFYQGVAKALSQAIQFIDIRRKTVRVAESAVSWILRRSHSVRNVNVYLVEPGIKACSEGLVLRRMMTLCHDAAFNQHYSNPARLDRKDNLFKDYLFKCVESSDTITADAYGERHMAFPLRDGEGRAVAVIDISIGTLKSLPSHEDKEIQRMLRLLAMAHREVAEEVSGVEKNIVLEVEKEHEDARVEVLFDRLMLLDLRENVGRLDTRAFAEIKSYKDPPKIIHDILKAVLGIFFVVKSDRENFEEWNTCKQYVTQDLSHKIATYDPTAKDNAMFVDSKALAEILQQVPQHLVAKHGSLPAQFLYNWAFVCLSLIEHTAKMAENRPGRIVSPGQTSSLTETVDTNITKTQIAGDKPEL